MIKSTYVVGVIGLMLASTALAAEPQSRSSEGQHTFVGLKGGLMQPDGNNNDSALNIGAVIGQPVQRYFSWEAEFTLTASDGKVGANNNWDITTAAGYAVFRSEGDVGFKAKLGLAYWDTDTDDDISLSTGIGAGVQVGDDGMLDIEFTQIDDGVDFISIGYLFHFR